MSIRLLQSIFIAGVLSPVDGTTLSLSTALEADLVNQGKAIWVSKPGLPMDVGKAVTAPTDSVCGGLVLLPNGPARLVGTSLPVATLGDSIASQNISYAVNGVQNFPASGFLTWLQMRLGYPFDFQNADNFAVTTTTTSQFVAANGQLDLLLAAHQTRKYNRVFVSGGTNDINADATAWSTVIANLTTIFRRCLDAGIIPAFMGILPRGSDGAMTNNKLAAFRVNDWAANYAEKYGGMEFLNLGQGIADCSTAFGNALSSHSDGTQLHPNDTGGYWMGKIAASYYQSKGLVPGLRFANTGGDLFDAAYNPSGSCFLAANTGLVGGTTAPTGMTSAGSTGTWSKTTYATPSGTTNASSLWTGGSATVSGAYLYDDNIANGAWSGGGELISEGDVIYGQALVNVAANLSGSLRMSLVLVENDGVSNALQGSACGSNAPPAVPALEAGLYYLRTPNITVRPYAGSGNASVFQKFTLDSLGATGTQTVEVRKFELRKVIP